MEIKAKCERWIRQLRVKWILLYTVQLTTISLGLTLVLGTLLIRFYAFSPAIFFLLWLLSGSLLLLLKPIWKITAKGIASYLDANFPVLEDSTSLFLKPTGEVNALENLQLQKIAAVLPLKGTLAVPLKKAGWGLVCLLCGFLFTFLIQRLNIAANAIQPENTTIHVKENILPAIAAYKINIRPPAYTRKPESKQQQFSLQVETGALVSWNITTDKAVEQLGIKFNEKAAYQFKPVNAARTHWEFKKVISEPGFYQLVLDQKASDLYAIAIIPDLPAKIKIIDPKQNTAIDVGQPQKITLNLQLTDDYGISDAFVTATLASGKGEGVSFTEKKLLFNTKFNNQTIINIKQNIDLQALGMKPGDELYFFVTAKDNQGQQSRSDVYFVSIADPAELLSMAGMTGGVNLVPEYFRSQRQLIIDTEKLLKEEKSLAAEVFNSRSNELGADQKLLRLRYGQFLGEEAESGTGEAHGHDEHAPEDPEFGNAQSIINQYAHQHDNAEDATYFEPEMKARLKAVLTEMWNAELQLRTYKPQAALPFEYKALRLLKELQQKSRVYVAKTTLKTTRLKPEKRLSGELDKIFNTSGQHVVEPETGTVATLREVLSILEARKQGEKFDGRAFQLLQAAEKQLVLAAAGQPQRYLPALKQLRVLTANNKINLQAIGTIQQALQQLIGTLNPQPLPQNIGPAADLYQTYFKTLQQTNK